MKDVQKLLGPWSLESAIKQRVEKEATAEWALTKSEPFQTIPLMVVSEWSEAPLHALARGMFKQIKSVMP